MRPRVGDEMAQEPPNGALIEDLAKWRRTIDALPNPIHAAFYELLLFTGFREGEALTLEWKHVHRMHQSMTKNGRSFDRPILQVHHEIFPHPCANCIAAGSFRLPRNPAAA